MSGGFVHLHTHSHFSLLDGAASPEALVRRAAQLGMPALALTDHDAMFGAVRFYRAAREAGVHPVIGLELTVGPGAHHVTLLAENNDGYRSLCRLSTAAMSAPASGGPEPAGGRPAAPGRPVPLELLWEAGDGLIVLSGCRRGIIPALLRAGRRDDARREAVRFLERFGPERFFIELQDHGLPGQAELNRALAELADELGLGVVATNNVHYAARGDAEAHDALLALGAGARLDDPDRLRFGSAEYYMKSPGEMQRLFRERPDALENTVRIAQRCRVELELGRVRLPKFRPAGAEGGSRGAGPEASASAGPGGGAGPGAADRILAERAWAGARSRFGGRIPAAAEERLRHELDVIAGMGMADYFLLVADIVQRARELGIPVGPGRGSAAGSLVAYSLHITDVDPLQYGLVFERFLNPQRLQMPDIDVDVCDTRRDELLREVRERYGRERVAHIAAFGTLAARAALRDMGRVLDVPAATVDRAARMVPAEPGMTLAEAQRRFPALQRLRAENERTERWFRLAEAVEGTPRHLSVHAAGIVIGDGPLAGRLPLVAAEDGAVVTQYPMEDVEALGFLKMDILGLRTLTVVDQAKKLAAAAGRAVPDPLPLDDEAVYAALNRFGTEGVFQLETPMFQRLAERLRPDRFSDLVALVALGRPGPGERVDDFIRRRHGRQRVVYHHPLLEPILEETYGVIVYQEQVMRIAVDVAGYSPAEADLFRRAISAKSAEALQSQRERFVAGAEANGVPAGVAGRIFDELAAFAGYGFNKSHSVAYALLSYETAYLRTHYPAEFFAALMSSWKHNPQRLARYAAAARRMGVRVLPPDVNTSPAGFGVVDGAVAFGLEGVRHVGRAAAEAIVAARADGPFRSFADLVRRLPGGIARRRLFESLIEAGACDSLGESREAMLRAAAGQGGPPGAGAVGQTSLFQGIRARSDSSDTIESAAPLVIDAGAEAAAHFPALKRLLAAYPGPVPVVLRVDTGDAWVAIRPAGPGVAPTPELMQKLNEEVGRGRLRRVLRRGGRRRRASGSGAAAPAPARRAGPQSGPAYEG